jgi:hypothetical protein
LASTRDKESEAGNVLLVHFRVDVFVNRVESLGGGRDGPNPKECENSKTANPHLNPVVPRMFIAGKTPILLLGRPGWANMEP